MKVALFFENIEVGIQLQCRGYVHSVGFFPSIVIEVCFQQTHNQRFASVVAKQVSLGPLSLA